MRLIGKLLTQSMVLRKHSRRGRRGASMAFIESERDLFQYPLRSALQNCQRWLVKNKPLSINREKRDGYNSRGYYFSRRPATRNANDAIRSDTRCRRLRRTTFRFGTSQDGSRSVQVRTRLPKMVAMQLGSSRLSTRAISTRARSAGI